MADFTLTELKEALFIAKEFGKYGYSCGCSECSSRLALFRAIVIPMLEEKLKEVENELASKR